MLTFNQKNLPSSKMCRNLHFASYTTQDFENRKLSSDSEAQVQLAKLVNW